MLDYADLVVTGHKRAHEIFKKDLEALPEEAFFKSFGEKARTVADIVYEVTLVNGEICKGLQRQPQSPWPDEGWIKAPDTWRSKDDVVSAWTESATATVAVVEQANNDNLDEMFESERGPRSRYGWIQFMGLHMWYHSGQFNYIQTLIGDDGWHW